MSENKNLSRRGFLKTTGLLGAGSLMLPKVAFGRGEGQVLAGASTAESVIPKRPFGKTGVDVSILSLGGMFDIPSNQLLLRQAMRWGVTHWDTAASYSGGRSEQGIGQFFERNSEARKEIFLVTKSGARNPGDMTENLNRSLERMKTDHVDLYFVHAVRNVNGFNAEVKAWAEKAKSQGKIRFFGFSTHSNMEDCLQGAVRLGWIDVVMMTYNFRLMHTDRMKIAVDACTQVGIGLTAMKTQGGGSVRIDSESEMRMGGRFLREGFTDGQAKLLAVWEDPRIANICSQMPNLTLLMSNVAAALKRTTLSWEGREDLMQFAAETVSSYCAGCSDVCEGALDDRHVPVQDVMRCLMYHRNGQNDAARELFASIPEAARRRMAQDDFRLIEERCPHRMPIGKLMNDALSTFA